MVRIRTAVGQREGTGLPTNVSVFLCCDSVFHCGTRSHDGIGQTWYGAGFGKTNISHSDSNTVDSPVLKRL